MAAELREKTAQLVGGYKADGLDRQGFRNKTGSKHEHAYLLQS